MENENINVSNTTSENVDTDIKKMEERAEVSYNFAMNLLNSYNLEWTFRSINFVLNKKNISFAQLRSCVYVMDDQAYFDYFKSTLILVEAGLVGSKQYKETDTELLENRAYEIIDNWREKFGYVGTLHLLIIHVMETKHFFMNSQDQDIVNYLSSKNLLSDIAPNLTMEDTEEKIRQAQALKLNS